MCEIKHSDIVFSPEDLIVIARISLPTAYKIIKELNCELEQIRKKIKVILFFVQKFGESFLENDITMKNF